MKIQTEKQLGLLFQENSNINRHLFKVHYEKYVKESDLSQEEFKYYTNELIDLILNPTQKNYADIKSKNPELQSAEGLCFPVNKNFVFSEKALAISKSIKIDLNKFDPVIISSLKEGRMCTFLCGKNLMFRYWYRNNQLLGMIMEFNETDGMIRYVNFRLKASDSSYYFPQDFPDTAHWKDTYFIQFLQLLFFFEFSDVEYKVLSPNQKYGTKKTGNYLNETKNNVTVVDSNWNIVTINDNQFTVHGHTRMQACGPNLSLRKLIFIQEFTKEGYTRKGKGTV